MRLCLRTPRELPRPSATRKGATCRRAASMLMADSGCVPMLMTGLSKRGDYSKPGTNVKRRRRRFLQQNLMKLPAKSGSESLKQSKPRDLSERCVYSLHYTLCNRHAHYGQAGSRVYTVFQISTPLHKFLSIACITRAYYCITFSVLIVAGVLAHPRAFYFLALVAARS